MTNSNKQKIHTHTQVRKHKQPNFKSPCSPIVRFKNNLIDKIKMNSSMYSCILSRKDYFSK